MSTSDTTTAGPVPFGDLGRQYRALRDEIDAAVARVLASGWFVLGEEGRAFERAFAAHFAASSRDEDRGAARPEPEAVGCANGTDAIALALWSVGVSPGDEVVVPALTAMPTATAVLQVGAKPVFADVDPETGLVTAETLAAVATERTKALVAVHLYGQSCAMGPIQALGEKLGAHVIEDAAQAHGARDAGRPVGWGSAAATFSFYPSKNLGAFGDGGAVLTRDAARAARLRRLRDYGQRGKYEHDEFGINSRLDEIQAAILRVKLPRLDAWNDRRRAIAARYDRALEGHANARPLVNRQGDGHARHLYPVRCADVSAMRASMERAGVGTAVHYPKALPEQGAIESPRGAWEHAEGLAHALLSLPIYPELADAEVDRVCEALARGR